MYWDKLNLLIKTWPTRIGLYFVSMVLVAFARPYVSTLLCLLAGFVGYGLFFYSICRVEKKQTRFFLGFIWFFLVQAALLFWLATPKYQGLYVYGLHAILSVLLAVQFAFFTLWASLRQFSLKAAACGASFWTLLELSRLYFLCGFIWNPLGLMLTATACTSQLAAFVGVYGLSWCVMFIALLFYTALEGKRFKSWSFYVAAIGALVAVSSSYLSYQKKRMGKEEKSLKVALVQTSIYPVEKNFFLKYAEQFIHPVIQWHRIWTMVEKRFEKGLDLIVLPEAAVFHAAKSFIYDSDQITPFLHKVSQRVDIKTLLKEPFARQYQHNGEVRWWVNNLFFVKALAVYFDVEVIAGFEELEKENTYASAFFVTPEDVAPLRYDKRVLLPVAEYLPLEMLRNLAVRYGMTGFFTPGEEATVFEGRGLYFPTICYEECFGSVVKEGRLAGGEILVSLNNDAWYPHSNLNYTHFDHGRVRAIENGVYQLRACNTGVTAAIDPFGRTVAALVGKQRCDDVRDALVVDIPRASFSTLYSRQGNRVIVVWSILTILFYYTFKRRDLKNT